MVLLACLASDCFSCFLLSNVSDLTGCELSHSIISPLRPSQHASSNGVFGWVFFFFGSLCEMRDEPAISSICFLFEDVICPGVDSEFRLLCALFLMTTSSLFHINIARVYFYFLLLFYSYLTLLAFASRRRRDVALRGPSEGTREGWPTRARERKRDSDRRGDR